MIGIIQPKWGLFCCLSEQAIRMGKTINGIVVFVDDYIPTLDERDVTDLVNFMVELFCAEKAGEVQND